MYKAVNRLKHTEVLVRCVVPRSKKKINVHRCILLCILLNFIFRYSSKIFSIASLSSSPLPLPLSLLVDLRGIERAVYSKCNLNRPLCSSLRFSSSPLFPGPCHCVSLIALFNKRRRGGKKCEREKERRGERRKAHLCM